MKEYVNCEKNDNGEIVSIDLGGPIHDDPFRFKKDDVINIIEFQGYKQSGNFKVKVEKEGSFKDAEFHLVE